MKKTEIIMGMPITIEIVGNKSNKYFDELFSYFRQVDARFSTYKKNSEISKINRGLDKAQWSAEMKLVLELCEQTKHDTRGYFNIEHNGKLDPSGLVKGWSINNAAKILEDMGVDNFYIEAGGDIQVNGSGPKNDPWIIGIRNPFKLDEIIKSITVKTEGVATSGTYIRGQHIYNPYKPDQPIEGVSSLTVIGPDIYEADRYATAAFAMGLTGIDFIQSVDGFEGYMVSKDKTARYTNGFERYVVNV